MNLLPFIDVSKTNKIVKEQILSEISKILDSGIYVLGSKLEKFEKEFALYCNTKYCVGVNSGTDALRLSLQALEIDHSEVATVSYTFPATIQAIYSINCKPIYVDITNSGTMDPIDLERKITKNTKAIIPVHFMGHPSNMIEIKRIADKYQIPIIEDACQSVGATLNGQKMGSFGETGCFSFFPTKNLSCLGDGGAIVTNNEEIYKKLLLLRNFGRTERESFVDFGLNSRLDEIQAAILLIKLEYLDYWLKKRRDNVRFYKEQLQGFEFIDPIENSISSYHLFAVKVKNNQIIKKKMEKYGIDCRIHYSIPCHLQEFSNQKNIELPKTKEICESCLTLPLSEFITYKEMEYIIQCLKRSII